MFLLFYLPFLLLKVDSFYYIVPKLFSAKKNRIIFFKAWCVHVNIFWLNVLFSQYFLHLECNCFMITNGTLFHLNLLYSSYWTLFLFTEHCFSILAAWLLKFLSFNLWKSTLLSEIFVDKFSVLHFFANKELSYDVCNNQYETLFIKLDSINKNSNESNSLFTKTNYLTGFDLIGRDLWFPKKFWIFTTEFLVIMSFFMAR